MKTHVRIALDAMGGDRGPETNIPAAGLALEANSNLQICLVGQQDKVTQHLKQLSPDLLPRIEVVHAADCIASDDSPAKVLRAGRDSSMRVVISRVKHGLADACVSAGNTGALAAFSRFILKGQNGIDRPAIFGQIPSIGGHSWMLDLGASVDCSANQLLQFAIMGSELATAIDGTSKPRVALLNIGSEIIKGNRQVRLADELLKGTELNYVGFIEGDGLYTGEADVIVCDGFVGNVALKSSEGVSRILSHTLRKEFMVNTSSRLRGLVAAPVLKRLQTALDPRSYYGGGLLGLNGVVMKSHGSADSLGIAMSIQAATRMVEQQLVSHIGEQLNRISQTKQPPSPLLSEQSA